MKGVREGTRLVGLLAVVAAGYVAGSMLSGDGIDWLGLTVVAVGTLAVLGLLRYFRAEFDGEDT
ncbi:hypothetical protein [Halostella salina]|uniref:hypothetical protein n=1 Tax=Halostella salina TaxID=1547897 RepID=UPI000EF78622|nr:hypothetical protein [Halostella salina]